MLSPDLLKVIFSCATPGLLIYSYILGTVHVRVLKFHMCIQHEKSCPVCFLYSCLSYLPFLSYDP